MIIKMEQWMHYKFRVFTPDKISHKMTKEKRRSHMISFLWVRTASSLLCSKHFVWYFFWHVAVKQISVFKCRRKFLMSHDVLHFLWFLMRILRVVINFLSYDTYQLYSIDIVFRWLLSISSYSSSLNMTMNSIKN